MYIKSQLNNDICPSEAIYTSNIVHESSPK